MKVSSLELKIKIEVKKRLSKTPRILFSTMIETGTSFLPDQLAEVRFGSPDPASASAQSMGVAILISVIADIDETER